MFILIFIASGCAIIGLSITAGFYLGRYLGANQVEAKILAYIEKHPTAQNIKLGEMLFNSHLMHRE